MPKIVKESPATKSRLNARLRESADAEAGGNTKAMMNISLALLHDEPERADFLFDRLLEAEPRNFAVLIASLNESEIPKDLPEDKRKALGERLGAVRVRLWSIALAPDSDVQQRLRASAALAKYEPNSPKWNDIAKGIVEDLVRESPVELRSWLEPFRPINEKLRGPLKECLKEPLREATGAEAKPGVDAIAAERANDLFAAERAAKRSIAAELLLNYIKDDPQSLTEALLESDENQYPKFFDALKTRGQPDLYLLTEIGRELDGIGDPALKERIANRMVNAAVYLILQKNADSVWRLLRLQPEYDPRVRSYLISRLGRLGVNPKVIADQIENESDVSIKRALIQSLGNFPEGSIPAELKAALTARIQRIYGDTPDPGLRASAEWLLRRWIGDVWLHAEVEKRRIVARGMKPDSIARAFGKPGDRSPAKWFVNGNGHAMVAPVDPLPFLMGSPPYEVGRLESENLRSKAIGRSFAISSKLTTIDQYDRFDNGAHSGKLPKEFREPRSPVVRASWYEVAKYCNWLSHEEGLDPAQWCYITDPNGVVIGMKPNYLALSGYRLPTDAEVEYANRAGAKTCRYFGETEELLGEYAWYQRNSGDSKNSAERTHPVGLRKPNDFGLFDMQGNAFTWCQDSAPDSKTLPALDDALPDEPLISPTQKRVLRGGAFYFMAISLRAARRHDDVPTMQGLYYSFRVAKTLK